MEGRCLASPRRGASLAVAEGERVKICSVLLKPNTIPANAKRDVTDTETENGCELNLWLERNL
jgi:hypothetical protein